MDFFASMGCCVSDHALEYVMYAPASAEEIESIFAKRLAGNAVTKEEELKFKTAFMVNVGKEYTKRNWVMQLHYGCKRDNNTPMFNKLGPDTGYDCINNYAPSSEMADFLNALNQSDELPKTIIYSLNPNDNQPSAQSSAASRIPPQSQKSSRVPHGGSTITRPACRIR